VVVLAETIDEHSLGPFVHLGVACETKDEVDQLADVTRQDGCFQSGPFGAVGEPTGYFVNLERLRRAHAGTVIRTGHRFDRCQAS